MARRSRTASVFWRCIEFGVGPSDVVGIERRRIGSVARYQFSQSDARNGIRVQRFDQYHPSRPDSRSAASVVTTRDSSVGSISEKVAQLDDVLTSSAPPSGR